MAINTLITLRDKLQEFADGHAQIQRIYFGADDKRAPVLTDTKLFPAVYVAPIDKVSGRAHDTHRLRIYVYERLDSGASDEWENANDTSLIFRDFRVWWNDYGTDDILIESDPTGTFKTDSELDNLVGYFGEFLFQIPSHGRCDVPVSITPAPSPTCAPVTYNVEYANGTPIESGSQPSGGHIEVIVPNCPTPALPNTGIYKSGQTIIVLPSDAVRNLEGMGSDWWNLDPAPQNANIFGHFKRFTGTTGSYQDEVSGLFFDKDGDPVADYATAFPLGIVVDWSTRKWQYGKVLVYGLGDIVAGSGATRASLNTTFEALNVGIYSNWKLPNMKELFNLLNFGLSDRTGYRPLNNITELNAFFWARDSNDALTGCRINLGSASNGIQVNQPLTQQNRGLPVSYLTISGTTLI